ncbi:M67 family metallopeptidase [Sphingomonas carotinifaciens]|uniref:M67 family metallopeptidase n=1 Tax=Sphingomonas carotinifaciens TaxID=1166323 RepID=UPI000DDAA0C2|nr:M67 family metallopeptidase [Sphingomonas carotinifaciens]
MTVTISSDTLKRIRAAAAASPMVEVCGLLLGEGAHIREARACDNVSATPATRFEIDPAALLAAYRAARGGGPAVLGHYHSHPSGHAEPSPRDAEDALPDGRLWLLVAGDTVTAWRAVAAGERHGRFTRVTLACEDPAAPSDRQSCWKDYS